MRFIEVNDNSGQMKQFHVGGDDNPRMEMPFLSMKDELHSNVQTAVCGDVAVAWAFVTPNALDSPVVVVGSNEHHTPETLMRIAELTADMLRFLGFAGDYSAWQNGGPTPNWSANGKPVSLVNFLLKHQARMVRRFINYIYMQMEQQNLSLLLGGVTRNRLLYIDRVGAPAFRRLDTMICTSHQAYMEEDSQDDHRDCPGYACAFLGDRLIEESGEETLHKYEASDERFPGYALSNSDKYLVHLLVLACSYPQVSPSIASEVESTIKKAEKVLAPFGLTRDTVKRNTKAREALEIYLKHLEEEDRSETALSHATVLRTNIDSLEHNVAILHEEPFVAESTEGDLQRLLPEQETQLLPNWLRACYSRADLERTPMDHRELTVVWLNHPVPGNDAGGMKPEGTAASEYWAGARVGLLEILRIPMPERHREEWTAFPSIFGGGPDGCDVGLLFFPKPSHSPHASFCPWLEVMEACFRGDFANHLAWGNYPPDFVQHPAMGPDFHTPVGLQYYCFVDRSTNTTSCCNPEWLAASVQQNRRGRGTDHTSLSPEQRRLHNAVLQKAVAGIHNMMLENMSKAHSMISQGYQEGLWGHLGFQFHYKVRAVDIPKRGKDSSSSSAAAAPQPNTVPLGVQHYNTMTRRPYRLSDALPRKHITELYCLYVGSMSPEEVENSSEALVKFLLTEQRKHAEQSRACGILTVAE